MSTITLCARRVAIAAALIGGSLAVLAGVNVCATGMVRAGVACAGYGAAMLALFGG